MLIIEMIGNIHAPESVNVGEKIVALVPRKIILEGGFGETTADSAPVALGKRQAPVVWGSGNATNALRNQ